MKSFWTKNETQIYFIFTRSVWQRTLLLEFFKFNSMKHIAGTVKKILNYEKSKQYSKIFPAWISGEFNEQTGFKNLLALSH